MSSSDGEQPHDKIFWIEAAFDLRYGIGGEEACDDKLLDAFSRMNGIYNAWPYWREYVQSTVGRMGLPPVTLPVLTGNAIEKMIQSQEAGKAIAEPHESTCPRPDEKPPSAPDGGIPS